MAGALLGVLMMLLVVPFRLRGESAWLAFRWDDLLAITTLAATAGARFRCLTAWVWIQL